MADSIPELREGDPYPGADYFNTLRRFLLRALRITVEDGSGLTVSQGMDGTVIGGAAAGGGTSGTGVQWWMTGPDGVDARAAGTPPPTGDAYPEGGLIATPFELMNVHYEAIPPWRLCAVVYDGTRSAHVALNWGCSDVPAGDRPDLT